MSRKINLDVKGIAVSIVIDGKGDFISLTDIARFKDTERSDYILQNWMRNRSTIEFIGLWEQFHNPVFNSIEFDGIKNMAGSNSFSLTPKRWIEATNAIGIMAKTGRYGGTYAHKDIAFEFASWLSAEFKFYLIKEFQRLKSEESERLKLEWNLQRTLAKVNYFIHTDAIKKSLIPQELTRKQASLVYATEADVLNMALFGLTASDWRAENPSKSGNIRDFATLEQLVVLTNLESMNALFIQQGITQADRLLQLNKVAIHQLNVLFNSKSIKKIKGR
jgi:hypothetical protein